MFTASDSLVELTTGWWHIEQVAALHWKNLVKVATLAWKVVGPSGL